MILRTEEKSPKRTNFGKKLEKANFEMEILWLSQGGERIYNIRMSTETCPLGGEPIFRRNQKVKEKLLGAENPKKKVRK